MNPGETVRYACGECKKVFDLYEEWPATWGETDADQLEIGQPLRSCPFCESEDLSVLAPHMLTIRS
jgi:hypothetical protein